MKVHRIKVDSRLVPDAVQQLNAVLRQKDPAASVKLLGEQQLELQYDVRKLTFGEIRSLLEKSGYRLAGNLFQRLAYSKWSFTEENERDNLLASPAPCCSNPEEILRKSKTH